MVQIIDCHPNHKPEVDFAAIKTRQQAMWASGDFTRIGVTLQIVGESLCEAVDLRAGSRVLDVAAGNGNAALAAARRGCEVTASDYVLELLHNAARRAAADGLPLTTRLADAERLPFIDGEYDVVLSTYGVMFAPDQEAAARELVRVCRPGGRIGLANWTPDGFIGQLLRVVGRFVPPPAGVRSPAMWGTETRLAELFGADAAAIHVTRKNFVFRYRSPADFVNTFRAYYGPTFKAFDALPEARRPELADAIAELCRQYDQGGGHGLCVPGEYLEVVIDRR
jgi:2-polyprenyl-3-methyl-5-hydroxy-6-metoxy-1,4-benzoquinol methylase